MRILKKWEQDPEGRRRRILDAAHVEFARHGFDGARVDRIAAAADVNKRSLYYLVGYKDDVYLAVLEETYERIRSAERKLNLDTLCPPDAVARLVEFTWDYFRKNPEFISMLNTENLLEARYLKTSKKIKGLHSPFVELLDDILRRGVDSGDFRPDVDPVELYISIAGLCWFFFSNQRTLSVVFGRNLTAAESRLRRLKHTIDFVLAALAPAPSRVAIAPAVVYTTRLLPQRRREAISAGERD